MAARHGTISPTLRAGVPFWGGLRGGGGGAGGCCVHPPMRGGVAGGSSVRLGRKNPVASPGLVGPFEEEPRIRRGGLRYMVWYGMVWYGMVWYGMVWYGMVWYGMVWYGMVWYGMVWYGMVWYGMVWYGMVWYASLPSDQFRPRHTLDLKHTAHGTDLPCMGMHEPCTTVWPCTAQLMALGCVEK